MDARAATTVVRRVTRADPGVRDGLRDLLIDAVHGGASVGFLAPLSAERAQRYWAQVAGALAEDVVLWVAEEDGRLVGTVQLALCGKENGRHRAEVQKLLVLRSHRGRGIARRLMEALEGFARGQGRTLLFLDTLAGSPAESVYRSLGWAKAGEIPDYAAMPGGDVRPTAFYYKHP